MNNVKNGPVSVGLMRFWIGVGWFGLALLLYLSLTPTPPSFDMQYGDKIGHMLAYATLMFWWAQRWVTVPQRFALAAGLIGLGIVIEIAQGWTGWRSFDYADMRADAAGAVLGWIAAACLPNLLNTLTRLPTGQSE